MSKPSHFREVGTCGSCKNCKCTYHHCSACSDDDEYTCKKHDFELTEYLNGDWICDDYEEDRS